MNRIKIISSNNVVTLQHEIDEWIELFDPNIRSTSISTTTVNDKIKYVVSITYDDKRF